MYARANRNLKGRGRMFGVETETIAALFAVAAVAGCFDAIAGGGGLLTVPALLIAGLDPVSALATNKLQSSAGSLSATAAFARRGLIEWRSGLSIAAAAAAASIGGALSVSLLPRPVLEMLVPILLIVIAFYFVTAPRLRDGDAKALVSLPLFTFVIAPAVGFYDGVFGPGAGSFYMVGFVSLLGFGAVRATGYTKLSNAASNVGSLALFAAKGAVIWPVGLAMACGAFMGAQIGAALAMRLGSRLIRPLLVTISSLMSARLLLDPENPLRLLVAAGLRLVPGGYFP
jgi:uncharacterized membrane protein YfcA